MKFLTRQNLSIAVLTVLCSGAAVAQAPTPRTISFQGVLADAAGTFVADGVHSITLHIYDAPVGGTALFTETQNITVARGVFGTTIGSTMPEGLPAGLSFDRAYYLGVTVDGGVELSPRSAMTTVPYAIAAETARRVEGGAVTSLNGQQGSVNIIGADGTTITTEGSTLIIGGGGGTIDTSGIRQIGQLGSSLRINNPAGPLTTIDVATNGIRTEHIVDGAIVTAKIADGAVTAAKIADDAITSLEIAPGAISTTDMADNAITSPKIVDGQVMASDIADLNVTTAKIAADAITSAKIADGQVQTADLADNAVSAAKINASGTTAGQSLISNGSGTPVWGTPIPGGSAGGDLAGAYPNPTIAPTAGNSLVAAINGASTTGSIAYQRLALTNSVSESDLAGSAVTTNKIADTAVTTAKLVDGSITGTKLADGAVDTDHIVNSSVTDAKIASLSYAKLTGAPASLPPTGAAGGDLAGSYPNPTVANNAITSTKIADGAITDADVAASAAIGYSKLSLANSIVGADITANAVTTAKIADAAVTLPKIDATGAINGQLLGYNGTSIVWMSAASGTAGGDLTGTYPNPTVAPNAITTAKIADGAITDDKVANGISYSKLSGAPSSLPPSGTAGGDLSGTFPNPTIANNAITSTKIADGAISDVDVAASAAIGYSKLSLTNSLVAADITINAVTTEKIADGAVTDDKLATGISYSKLSGAPTSLPPSGAAGGDLSGSYPSPTVAPNAISTAKIADLAVTDAKVALNSITYAKLNLTNSIVDSDIVNGTITTSKLADSAITGVKILTRAVDNRHIASGAVTPDKISTAGASAGNVLAFNGFTVAWSRAVPMFSRTVITSASHPYSMPVTADLIGVNQTTAITIILPSAAFIPSGKVIIINSEEGTFSSSTPLTIQASPGNTINGSSSMTIESLYQTVRLYSNGVGGWFTF